MKDIFLISEGGRISTEGNITIVMPMMAGWILLYAYISHFFFVVVVVSGSGAAGNVFTFFAFFVSFEIVTCL